MLQILTQEFCLFASANFYNSGFGGSMVNIQLSLEPVSIKANAATVRISLAAEYEKSQRHQLKRDHR